MKTVRKSFLVFIAIATVYLFCSLLEWTKPVFYLKPFLLIPLMIAVYSSHDFFNKKWLFYALTFSWVGDIMLLFVFKDPLFFIGGLVSFLIAHVLYILLFLKELNKTTGKFRAKQPGLLLIVLFIIAFYAFLNPFLGDLKIPVLVYAMVISFMLYVAYLLHFQWPKPSSLLLLTGALAFVISDSLLATNKFYASFPNAGFLVMLTYLYAQGALVWACLGKRGERLNVAR